MARQNRIEELRTEIKRTNFQTNKIITIPKFSHTNEFVEEDLSDDKDKVKDKGEAYEITVNEEIANKLLEYFEETYQVIKNQSPQDFESFKQFLQSVIDELKTINGPDPFGNIGATPEEFASLSQETPGLPASSSTASTIVLSQSSQGSDHIR